MDKITLIANSGIQTFTFPIHINLQERRKLWFHEWFDTANCQWRLDPVFVLSTDFGVFYYNKKELRDGGYLAGPMGGLVPQDLRADGITPLRIDDENQSGVKGDIFSINFGSKVNRLDAFENVWLPLPYFSKKTEKRLNFGPLNWARIKLSKRQTSDKELVYDAVLAFDTRVKSSYDGYDECPVFPDKFRSGLDFALCDNEFLLMDYCSADNKWSYIDEYLLSLVHPEVQRVSQIKGANVRKMDYIASYAFLISYFASSDAFPQVTLYRDDDVEVKGIDMIIDIGNSKTTALLIEDNVNFNQVRPLKLVDYTRLTTNLGDDNWSLASSEPFDMRLVFRRIDFGRFGTKDSMQFVYPSLVRLGNEAQRLLHLASEVASPSYDLSTSSSPKRYLWDARPSVEEWRFLTLEGETGEDILQLNGITNQLNSDGSLDCNGTCGGGLSHHYSRQSLMTFAFLEMFVQARCQINSDEHRSEKTGFGKEAMPRKIKRVVVTCPTAMSKVEREALVKCAKNAVILLENFDLGDPSLNQTPGSSIKILPSIKASGNNGETPWYFDEATCSQLVYMYGEVGYKYKGCCGEFFNLYGKTEQGDSQPSITIGSLDIGAGTSDLMISKYTYEKGDITSIIPEPQFYDSFYFAGDDVLYSLVKNFMLFDEDSSFRKALPDLGTAEFRQKMKNFFGPDYNGQSVADRRLRHDFNIQYSVPLLSHLLTLLSSGVQSKPVEFDEVFGATPPSKPVIEGFKKKTGIDVSKLSWTFDGQKFSMLIEREIEPLLKKVATIMYSYGCDIVLLSGRPSSLPPVRNLFLKYYPVSPNRLILLNNYYVGDWYPFCENTGYIKNPKTIVAMGGAVAFYASDLSNLGDFTINMDRLNGGLTSSVNYIEATRQGQPISYLLTPEKSSGELSVSSLPVSISVRQVGMDSYPCRPLYSIDFNRSKIGNKITRKLVSNGEDAPNYHKLAALVDDEIDKLKARLPFRLQIERDFDDWEKLVIGGAVDKDGNDVSDSNIEISTQSLGADGLYWLDSGSFDF